MTPPVTPPSSDLAAAARRRLTRGVLLALGAVVAVVLLWAFITEGWVLALALAAVPLLGAAIALDSTRRDRLRRRRALTSTFGGSVDAAAASLDKDAIRTLRDTRGELHAVREVRRLLPMLSLEQVAQIVRSL